MSNFDERDALTRELRNRSHDIDGGHPIALDSVKRRARKMKRRRQLAGGAAAAVVVAIAVPTAFALARQSSSSPQQAAHQPTVKVSTHHHAAKQSQAAKPSATAAPKTQLPAGVHALTFADAASGPAPRIGYLDGSTVRDPQGSFALPSNKYLTATPYHGGYLAVTVSPQTGDPSVVQVDGTGKVIDEQPGGYRLAISADGTEAAYFVGGSKDKPGTVRVGISSGMSDMENTQTVPAGKSAEPVGFVSGSRLVYSTDSASPKIYVTNLQGGQKQIPGLLALGGTDQMHNLLTGETQDNNDGTSCWAVLNASTGAEHWKTCDYALGKFSSDGKYVAAVPSNTDGLGATSVTILDANNGHPVAEFQAPSGSDLFVTQTAWDADTDSLLAIAHERGSWRILRLGTDGSVQTAAGPGSGPAEDAPYRFVATP